MSHLPLLLQTQKELLITIVEADQRLQRERRVYFNAYWWKDSAVLEHPGLENDKGNISIFIGDIEALMQNNLLSLHTQGKESYQFSVLAEGYLVYGLIKDRPSPEAQGLVRQVIADTLERARRALRILERSAAGYGGLTTAPVHIVTELEDKREEVAELERRLVQLDAAG